MEPVGEASPLGMLNGLWSTGIKQIFGTAYEAYDLSNHYSSNSPTAPLSRVWFTGGYGILTEIFWPTVDTAQIRDHQILVSDGNTFFFEERKQAQTEAAWIQQGVPLFRLANQDPDGRFRIERHVFTDPDRDVVIQRVRIERYVPGLKFYVLHNPAVGNSPFGDYALASLSDQAGLFAYQGNEAQAVLFSISLKQATAGFEGTQSDGWQDLQKDYRLDSHFKWAKNGNVVLTGWLDIPETRGEIEFYIGIGFGSSLESAHWTTRQSLEQNLIEMEKKYSSQWENYARDRRDLSGVSGDNGLLFRNSVALLKSMEDKSSEGAFVASPSMPWGQHTEDTSSSARPGFRKDLLPGYHVVWPRDLYQMATAFLAIDDPASAVASLQYLKRIQFGPEHGEWIFGWRKRSRNGSFPQNCWVGGEPHWKSLQLDETAVPVVLAYRLWKLGHIQIADYWDLVKRAADFIQEFGPWTAQERWEENFGASPSTIAAEIAALYAAANIAEKMEDWQRVQKYRNAADHWNLRAGDNVDSWTFTTSGIHGNGRYYTRLEGAATFDQIWNPNDESIFFLANG